MVTREQHGVKKGGQMINGRVQDRKDIQERKEADQGGHRTRRVHDRESTGLGRVHEKGW